MPEELVVRQCAPTLAGLKTGSLFRAACTDKKALLAQIRDLNQRLREKGLCLIPLRFRDGNALLYLYRPARLKIDLKNELARRTLGNAGYLDESPERCIVNLIRRFQGDEFPHEIGLFLSYPPEDVQGFIENHAQNYKLSGLWKVYGDEAYARAASGSGVEAGLRVITEAKTYLSYVGKTVTLAQATGFEAMAEMGAYQ